MSNNSGREGHFTLVPSIYLLLRRGDEVLLLRRANTGYMDGMYNLLAGHLEAGEPATEGMAREASEEAGITIDPSKMRQVFTGLRYNRERLDLVFEVREWQGEIVNREPERCDDLSWFPIAKLPENTVPYVHYMLGAIAAGATYGEYFEDV